MTGGRPSDQISRWNEAEGTGKRWPHTAGDLYERIEWFPRSVSLDRRILGAEISPLRGDACLSHSAKVLGRAAYVRLWVVDRIEYRQGQREGMTLNSPALENDICRNEHALVWDKQNFEIFSGTGAQKRTSRSRFRRPRVATLWDDS